MKFTITRTKFLDGLKSVQNIIGSKGNIQIIQNVMIEAKDNILVLTTTDLDISVRNTIECEVVEPGTTTVPAKLLFNSVSKAVEGLVEVETDSNEMMRIKAGYANFKIAGMPASEFPKLPVDEEACSYTIGQQALREMFRKTSYAASQDDTRRTLKGVLMRFKDSKLTMVATDGRRLALVEKEVEFPVSNEKDIILPSKTVQELQRNLDGEENVTITLQKTQLCFTFNTLNIYSKLIEDVYPNYAQVIPGESGHKITIDRKMLLDALDRVSVMTLDETHFTRLSFSDNCLTVSSAAGEIGEATDQVDIKYIGEKIDIVFNPTYIMEMLKAIDDDEVTIHLNSGTSPAMFKCSIPFLYVIMPLRIS